MTEQKEACPEWAVEKIKKLRELEIKLGNIIEADDTHQVRKLTELIQKQEQPVEDEGLETEQDAEAVFQDVVMYLTQQKHSCELITQWINQLMCPQGGLPYCDIAEVQAVIK